jgi:hypothetical protein
MMQSKVQILSIHCFRVCLGNCYLVASCLLTKKNQLLTLKFRSQILYKRKIFNPNFIKLWHKKRDQLIPFLLIFQSNLFCFLHHSFKSLWMIHG